MNLIVRSRGADLNDRLRSYATDRLGRAERFFDRILEIEVELVQEANPRVKDGHRVEVTAKTARDTLRAHGAGADFYAAIDKAADRLERRIKRFKGRLNHRSHRNGPRPQEAAPIAGAEHATESPEVVQVPQAVAKPMTLDEAILELEARGMQFLLFTDAATMGACVVYRRSDGAFGLIEHHG